MLTFGSSFDTEKTWAGSLAHSQFVDKKDTSLLVIPFGQPLYALLSADFFTSANNIIMKISIMETNITITWFTKGSALHR